MLTLNLPLTSCGDCPLQANGVQPHNYWGKLDRPHVLFIGDAPGSPDRRSGGRNKGDLLLMERLRKFKIENYAVINIIACRATKLSAIKKGKELYPRKYFGELFSQSEY